MPAYAYITAIAFVLFAASGWYLFSHYRAKNRLLGALNMQLFSVLVVPDELDSPERKNSEDYRNPIAVMEQLYAGMQSLRRQHGVSSWFGEDPAFALELALPSVGEEVLFYVAVPKPYARAFEKQVNGIFPHARVDRVKDYNIFNSEGFAAGSYLTLTRPPYYPIRTYHHLEADPLGVLSTAFSKLKKEGEGAAIQIMVRPSDSHWQKRGKEVARFLREGKSPREISKKDSFASELSGMVWDIVRGSSSSKSAKKLEDNRQPVFDEGLVTVIEEKAQRAGFTTNIRLLASAGTREDATAILGELENAFSQFNDPETNVFRIHRLDGKALQNLIYDFSFRMFDAKMPVYLATDELTSLYHFPVGRFDIPRVKLLKAREAAAPSGMPEEGLLMGENVFRGETAPVHMARDDRRRHLYVVGQTGTGKSNFLESLAVQDIQNGDGICFIDPHGEVVSSLLASIPPERADDVIYFDPGDAARPMGLNMLEYDPVYPEQKTFVVNELFSIFQKLYGAVPESMGPMFEQYFRNATMLVVEDPASGNTLLEVSRVLSDKAFRDLKLSRCNNVVVKTFWRDIAEKAGGEAALQNIVPYITSKFDIFLSNEIMRPIIASEHSSFNFREVMDSRKILLINLSKGRLGDINSSLLGLIIVGKLLMAALSRTDVPQEERKDFYLYIDEFQNVTTPSIAAILSEARKYRLNLIMSHQFIGQLEESIKKAVFGNVGSMALFRVGTEDADFLEQQFAPVFGVHDMVNIDNYHAYVRLLVHGQTTRPFSMRTLPAPQGDIARGEDLKRFSLLKYGRPRAEIEEEIIRKHERSEGGD